MFHGSEIILILLLEEGVMRGRCCFGLLSWAWLGRRRERPCYGAMNVGADLPKDHAGGQDLSLGGQELRALWPCTLVFLLFPAGRDFGLCVLSSLCSPSAQS